ncbi:branched-chain amino acid transferase (plasmid) [Mesorhizobium huakuii]|uniref:Probable branched-chain-amino-acid aminotransferase n=1 Tax=Mesorhizobium huakuii TaxID=28104 RepID=A0A7G6T6L9_9HYPH|nr:branched-chain amino acid transferase [Mesorhizobium huakuii]
MPSASDGIAFIDGSYVPIAEARIPILDRGFVRSDATYDVAHVWNGRFFRLRDHMARFNASMRGLRMTLPLDDAQIEGILTECVSRSGLRDAYVQMTCTRGVPPKGTRDPRLCENRFYAFAQPFVWLANEEQRGRGLSMIISDIRRIPAESIDPRIKNFHWLDLTMGIFEAYDRGATVVVLSDTEGNVTEGPGFNIFIVKDGALATPDSGVFEGMTRRCVVELSREIGIPCDLRMVTAAQVRDADEVFITSTAGGIMPVTTIDARPVSQASVGGITTKLRDLYWERHRTTWLGEPIIYKDEP